MSSPEAPATLSPGEARALFPALGDLAYFATNGHGLLASPTRDRVVAALDELARGGVGAAARLEAEVEGARARVARAIGADADEVGFVRNTGEGLCFVAEAWPWRSGDEVVVFDGEYRSVVHPFQALATRGVSVRVAPTDAGCVTPEAVARALGPRTRAVALAWVRYDDGGRADLPAISRILAPREILFVVDAIQGLGVFPIDVHACGIDFLAAGTHKWLLGLPGLGVLYLRRERLCELLPIHLGVTSMEDAATLHGPGDPYELRPVAAARRVEEGARNLIGIVALDESLALLARVGTDAVTAQVRAVTDTLCRGFESAGGRVRSPRGGKEWSGIFLLEPPPAVDAMKLALEANRARIRIGARDGALWGGAHFYNTLDDAKRLLALL